MCNSLRAAMCLMIALAAAFAAGCGDSSHINARGRITKGGGPFRLGEHEGLRIILTPMEFKTGHNESYAAIYDNDNGTFRVVGKDGHGLTPGKYQIHLQLMKKKEDLFKGKLFGVKSPFFCEVVDSGSEILIDLDQAKGLQISSRQ